MGPNAVKILDAWGFDPIRARSVLTAGVRYILIGSYRLWPVWTLILLATNQQIQVRSAVTGDVVQEIRGDWRERFGQPWTTVHRVDLHNELKRMAINPDFSGAKPALLRTGVRIADIVSILILLTSYLLL